METKNNSNRVRKPMPKIEADEIFKSQGLGVLILFLLIGFNALIFKGCFQIAYPKGMIGDREVEGIVYGLCIALIFAKVMFHEKWDSQTGWSAGSITLLINTLLVFMFFNPIELDPYWHRMALKMMMMILPMLGMLIIIISLQKDKSDYED